MVKEFDDSEIAWEVYKKIYEFTEVITKPDKGRKFITKTFAREDDKTFDIDFAGDTNFNFTKGFGHSRIDKMNTLIEEENVPKEYRKRYKNNLEICKMLTYSIVNVSLLPKTGNLQLAKQGIGNDRFDTFIWAINEYYENRCEIIFNHSSINGVLLHSYLDLFKKNENPTYVFCEKVYQIKSVALIDELIESGRVALGSSFRIMGYMNLAFRTWNQRIQILREKQFDENEIEEVCKILDGWY